MRLNNYILGTQIFLPQYKFSTEPSLIETARAILSMGSNILKCGLSQFTCSVEYCGIEPQCELKPIEIASHPCYQKVFLLPFEHYFLWVYSSDQKGNAWHSCSNDELARHKRDIYELVCYLLRQYSGTGKRFYVGNWEGDWMLMGIPFSVDRDPAPSSVKNMIAWLIARHEAVEQARKDTSHVDVCVYDYVEVNLVCKAMRGGVTMVNDVVPYIPTDFISYSCYDSLEWFFDKKIPMDQRLSNMNGSLKNALSYIESRACFTGKNKRVFIGEYGFPKSACKDGNEQDQGVRAVIKTALEWGCPFALYWQMYCNTVGTERANDVGEGFWLIDRDGNREPAYHTHKTFFDEVRHVALLINRRDSEEFYSSALAVHMLDWLANTQKDTK